jgi:hypothetical protein
MGWLLASGLLSIHEKAVKRRRETNVRAVIMGLGAKRQTKPWAGFCLQHNNQASPHEHPSIP